MNIKTTLTFISCLLCFYAHSQFDVNKNDATIEIFPKIKKGQKLKYQVKRINQTFDNKDTLNYQLNLEFDKIENDFATVKMYYSDYKEDILAMELINEIEVQIRLNIAEAEFNVTNNEDVLQEIKKNIKKLKRKYSNAADKLEILTSIENELNEKPFTIAPVFEKGIKSIFGFYKMEIPYDAYVSDTLAKNDPMGNPSKEVTRLGVFKQNDDYKFVHSKELLNDGMQKQLEEESAKVFKEQHGVDSLNVVSVSLEKGALKIEIKSDINVIYDGETGIVNSFLLIDKKDIFDMKILKFLQYTLIE